ncbi:MAG: hypothetical protein KBD06_05590 [Candidatus Pacebacteria bacterium]|nr:hypothetical protein [Candidatus Paceibacterota bacterium]
MWYWWILAIVGAAVVLIVIYCVVAFRSVDSFMNRCEGVLSLHRFMTPCEVAVAHAEKHGLAFGDIYEDAEMVSELFPHLEQMGRLIGREHEPDVHCECPRAYCLSLNPRRRRRRVRRYEATEVPDGKFA